MAVNVTDMTILVVLAKGCAAADSPQAALSADDKASDACGDDNVLFEDYTNLASLYRAGWDGSDETAVALLADGTFMDLTLNAWESALKLEVG